MVSEDFIFTVIDAQQEYDTKLFLFISFIIFLIFSLWWANRIIPFSANRDQRATFPIYKQVSVKLMRVSAVAFLFFMPLLFSIFMYREYIIENLIILMITGYSIITLIGLGIWFLFGMDWVQDLLALIGIRTKQSKGRIIRRRT